MCVIVVAVIIVTKTYLFQRPQSEALWRNNLRIQRETEAGIDTLCQVETCTGLFSDKRSPRVHLFRQSRSVLVSTCGAALGGLN